MDVAAWLQDLGLERYVSAFRDNDIDAEVLPKLTAEDLISIGVTSVGHRRKLLDAIAGLGMAVPTAVVAAPASGGPAQVDAERRQLTVMFCDIVGSTALSTRYDPEDLRELIGGYHGAVAETVGRFDGFVAKYMGDGVLIYFGYPQAHEDDAEQAVYAALAVIEAVSRLPAREDLRVRLGIATGLAVVGDLIGEGAAQERGVVGETPNLAARLQARATPNTLVIDEATRRQIGELFDLEDLGPQQLARFAEPQRAWRVLGESGKVSRFEALRSQETPLVGRDEEIELLRRRWEQAKSGEGRVVLISGEPGIGKSRLTAALSAQIKNQPHIRLRYFCSPHHQDSALFPFKSQLERAAGFVRDDTVDAKLGKLRALFAPGRRDDLPVQARAGAGRCLWHAAARATSPAAGQDTSPIGRFKPQIELKQAVFCRLVSCGTPRDQELGKPIHAGPRLSVLRPAARFQFGSYFGKALGTLADFPANLVADAAEIAEPDAVDGKQLLDGVHTHAVEHITRLDAVAELGDGAAAVETAGDGFNAVLCDSAAIQWLERAPPLAEHVLSVAEALFSIPAQGLREKVAQPLAQA